MPSVLQTTVARILPTFLVVSGSRVPGISFWPEVEVDVFFRSLTFKNYFKLIFGSHRCAAFPNGGAAPGAATVPPVAPPPGQMLSELLKGGGPFAGLGRAWPGFGVGASDIWDGGCCQVRGAPQTDSWAASRLTHGCPWLRRAFLPWWALGVPALRCFRPSWSQHGHADISVHMGEISVRRCLGTEFLGQGVCTVQISIGAPKVPCDYTDTTPLYTPDGSVWGFLLLLIFKIFLSDGQKLMPWHLNLHFTGNMFSCLRQVVSFLLNSCLNPSPSDFSIAIIF